MTNRVPDPQYENYSQEMLTDEEKQFLKRILSAEHVWHDDWQQYLRIRQKQGVPTVLDDYHEIKVLEYPPMINVLLFWDQPYYMSEEGLCKAHRDGTKTLLAPFPEDAEEGDRLVIECDGNTVWMKVDKKEDADD